MPNNNPTGKGGPKKGEVRNPVGRPRAGESFAELWLKHSKYAKDGCRELIYKLDKHIENGNGKITVDVLNRIFGKEIKVTHSGDSDNPHKMIIEVHNVGNKKAKD